MSDPVLVALIVSIPPTLASVVSLIVSLQNRGKLERIGNGILSTNNHQAATIKTITERKKERDK